jgi:acyl-coenzyme A synthetase/AMP-(fatty) acid ligase
MLAGLLSGATVLLTDGVLGPVEFAAAARGERATVLLSVPFLFRRYLEILRGEPGLAKAWSIRSCIAAGEPVRPDLIDAWRQLSGVRLRSHFGLTEGGHLTLASGEAEEGVGAPLADVELRVADGASQVRRRSVPIASSARRPMPPAGATPVTSGTSTRTATSTSPAALASGSTSPARRSIRAR